MKDTTWKQRNKQLTKQSQLLPIHVVNYKHHEKFPYYLHDTSVYITDRYKSVTQQGKKQKAIVPFLYIVYHG